MHLVSLEDVSSRKYMQESTEDGTCNFIKAVNYFFAFIYQ